MLYTTSGLRKSLRHRTSTHRRPHAHRHRDPARHLAPLRRPSGRHLLARVGGRNRPTDRRVRPRPLEEREQHPRLSDVASPGQWAGPRAQPHHRTAVPQDPLAQLPQADCLRDQPKPLKVYTRELRLGTAPRPLNRGSTSTPRRCTMHNTYRRPACVAGMLAILALNLWVAYLAWQSCF